MVYVRDNALFYHIQKCADPTIRNLEDLSPLDLAAQYDRLDIVKLLVKSHPELVAQRSAQNTPLHLASRNGHRAVVQFLLDSGFPVDARVCSGCFGQIFTMACTNLTNSFTFVY